MRLLLSCLCRWAEGPRQRAVPAAFPRGGSFLTGGDVAAWASRRPDSGDGSGGGGGAGSSPAVARRRRKRVLATASDSDNEVQKNCIANTIGVSCAVAVSDSAHSQKFCIICRYLIRPRRARAPRRPSRSGSPLLRRYHDCRLENASRSATRELTEDQSGCSAAMSGNRIGSTAD